MSSSNTTDAEVAVGAAEGITEEEANASPEDTLKFLRDRGVTIETPEDRAQAAAAVNKLAALKVGDPGTRHFKYVKIPASQDDPMVECAGVIPVDSISDQLPMLLAPKFGSGSIDNTALRSNGLLQMGGVGGALDRITAESVEKQGGMTEAFRLSDTIYMYLDEVGALKHLPLNIRAASFAAQCGYGQGVAFHGDMYIGRVIDGRNADFLLKDTLPEAEWIRTAAAENIGRQAQENMTGGISAEELSTRGGEGDGYSWKQDGEDVEISVPVPAGTKGKQIKVAFKSKHVKVIAPDISLDLPLYDKVIPDDCTWSLSDGALVITLTKAQENASWPVLVPK